MSNNTLDNTPTKNNGVLNSKVFSNRESLITELLKVKHFAIIKHVFLALIFGFVCRDFVRSLTNANHVDFGWSIITSSFANFDLALLSWICLFSINLLTYGLYRCWVLIRISLSPKSVARKSWDLLFLSLIVLYYIFGLYVFPSFAHNHLNLGIGSGFAIQMENIRFMMKAHAFVRHSAAEVLNYKEHSDMDLKLPPFSSYIYFSFAPTLVYRREYPRTEKVNVKYAVQLFLEVLLIIWLESQICEIFLFKPFQNVGKPKLDWKHVIVLIFESSVAGGTLMLVNFYLLLHAWLNAWAELLRFGDRRFYEDWWTSTNYSVYFRSWNVVVHDWLYEYIYRDFYHHVVPNKKGFAKLMVFLVSAVMHEHIIFLATRHFVPIVFIFFFCFGATFTMLRTKHPAFNILFLYSLALGNGIQLSLHTIEYFARANCPYSDDESRSYFVPRFLSMNCS